MKLSGQDKEMGFPPSSVYNPLPSAGGGGEDHHHHSIDNGSSVFKPSSQVLHCHPALLQQEQELSPLRPSLRHGCDPDPDAVHLAGATIASPAAGSNAKPSVRYRECLKNHAASVGGNIVDGCGEFMPDGEEGTLEALMCAACNCHRNFHRKEIDGETNGRNVPHHHFHPHPPSLASPPYLHRQKFPKGFQGPPSTFIVPPMSMAFGASIGATESSSEDLRVFNSAAAAAAVAAAAPPPPSSLSKKRFRTKFTQEQKEKMLEYAEKVGWRMQKQYEEQVQKLCAEVGVKRQVFKVWMHNNKNTLKKPQQQPSPPF